MTHDDEARAFAERVGVHEATAALLLYPGGYGLTVEEAEWVIAQVHNDVRRGVPGAGDWGTLQWYAEKARRRRANDTAADSP